MMSGVKAAPWPARGPRVASPLEVEDGLSMPTAALALEVAAWLHLQWEGVEKTARWASAVASASVERLATRERPARPAAPTSTA